MIHQPDYVRRQVVRIVGFGVMRLAAGPVAALIQGDHAMAGRQEADPSGLDPIVVGTGGKSVHEDDRIASTLGEVVDGDSSGNECRHQPSPLVMDTSLARCGYE
jgi:hypothetical protein